MNTCDRCGKIFIRVFRVVGTTCDEFDGNYCYACAIIIMNKIRKNEVKK